MDILKRIDDLLGEGKSTTPKYRVETNLGNFSWDGGTANAANLQKYINALNASLEPGGANAHLGNKKKYTKAKLVNQKTNEVVAEI